MNKLENPFTKRYSPNSRFTNSTGFGSCSSIPLHPQNFGDSITDKEAYRLSLLSGNNGNFGAPISSGSYAFPDGKYDPNKDISFIMRPDLSPVQIDEYIHDMENALKNADSELQEKIKSDLIKAQEVANEVAKKNTDTSAPTSN